MKKLIISIVITFFGLTMFLAAEKEIRIDLTKQMAYALRDGNIVFKGHISSGMPGRETPTGIYRITQKKVKHRSNLWPKPNGGARMPYMMRLGNTAMALHLGEIPGRPASHGCVRLEQNFAQKLFWWTPIGTLVRITGNSALYDTTNGYKSYFPNRNQIIKERRREKLQGSLGVPIRHSDEVYIKHGLLGQALSF